MVMYGQSLKMSREVSAQEALDMYGKMKDVIRFVDEIWPNLSGNQRSVKAIHERLAAALAERLYDEGIDLQALGNVVLGDGK